MKKKIEDYFSNAPEATYGSSMVVGREMPTTQAPEYATRESVPAPVWQAPLDQKPQPTYGSSMVVGREMPITQAAEYAPMQPAPVPTYTDRVPAAQVAEQPVAMPISDNQGHTVSPFNPAFVNITAPQVDTRSGTYAPQNVLRDTAGAPILSGSGGPITMPNQTTGNIATGGKGGAPMSGSAPTGGK